jgi:soluble lytic murein transglycosylase-like protein
MPSKWFSKCGIPYRFYEDGRIEVEKRGFPAWGNESKNGNKIRKIYTNYGKAIEDAAEKHGLKPAWIVGIILIESGGNPKACAPCVSHVNGKQFCAFAPNCGGPCCAYGLMQFIPMIARKYGKTGPHYMANPGDQIMDGAHLIAGMRKRYGGDICTTVKHYNGGSSCAGGGITGHGGQGDYVTKFIRGANTFVNLKLKPPGPDMTNIIVIGSAVLGAVAYWYADERYKLSDRVTSYLGTLI